MSYRGDREMHKATCGDCGKDCEVPFEPKQDKPVYCNDCFQNHKLQEIRKRKGLSPEPPQASEFIDKE